MAANGGKRLTFSTIFNVRDLGGYTTTTGPTKERRFLRSGDTMFLTDEDLASLLDYGVRRVVDLRMALERPELTDRFASVDGVAWMSSSMADDRTMTPDWMSKGSVVDFVVEGYQRMLADRVGVAQMVDFMAQANQNDCILFHCAGGMDRTGVVSFLVLGAAEATRDAIVADYAYAFGTDEEADGLLASWDRSAPPCPHDGIEARIYAMYELYDWLVATHGSVRAYLADCGVSHDHINALANHLLV